MVARLLALIHDAAGPRGCDADWPGSVWHVSFVAFLIAIWQYEQTQQQRQRQQQQQLQLQTDNAKMNMRPLVI